MRTITRSDAEVPNCHALQGAPSCLPGVLNRDLLRPTIGNVVSWPGSRAHSVAPGRTCMGASQLQSSGGGQLCCCLDSHLASFAAVPCPQMLSDMVIVNESRVGHSRVMQTFNKPRAYSLTLPMRFQVCTARAAARHIACLPGILRHFLLPATCQTPPCGCAPPFSDRHINSTLNGV